ncbi:nucleotidyltransferase family protein [Desulfocurvus vexinensis]|uniref:nucleotidyltransferase family protein n=1 Tax=Desulfocurvus vexinensis TaxID=399548 RepID=UPI00049087B4|nr:nucleotidyltransferase family protein [Desulfocurvus vexinensis]
MVDWRKAAVAPGTPIRELLAAIDASSCQIGLVVDQDDHLLGTVTDGDIRRGLLQGVELAEPVERVLNRTPVTAQAGPGPAELLQIMREKRVRQLPVLDGQGRVVALELLREVLEPESRDNVVVLMAGGLGTRLRPLTETCPKPMLDVGGRPILETILVNFRTAGFRRFCISVNYMAEAIEKHFGDGSAFGVHIDYLRETTRLGTAGGLSLLPERPAESFFVMNADLLTRVDFQRLLQFHGEHGAAATMCIREYSLQIPYGVVRCDGHRILGMEEKPLHTFFVNAGIYVLDPSALDLVEPGVYLDMPTLLERLRAQERLVAAFPIFEYWLDIGHMNDYQRARQDCSLFG